MPAGPRRFEKVRAPDWRRPTSRNSRLSPGGDLPAFEKRGNKIYNFAPGEASEPAVITSERGRESRMPTIETAEAGLVPLVREIRLALEAMGAFWIAL
jgi:hypothetical protein